MGKRIRVYAIVDVHRSFDLSDDLGTLFSGDARVQFAVARRGYTGQFVRLGADPATDVADVTRPTRARRLSVFVHGGEHGTLCPDCVADDALDIAESAVQTWLLGSRGWTLAPICDTCSTAIPVIVDGKP